MLKLSDSQLQTFKDCQLQYFFKYGCRLEPQEEAETQHDRAFGDGIHKGLAVLWQGGAVADAQVAFLERYPKALDQEDMAKTPETGKKLLGAYAAHYANEMKEWKVLSVEVLDEYEPVEGLLFRVKLDMVAENKAYGGVYGFDWKTTGKALNYAFWGQFNPSSQINAYTDYLNRKHGACSGFYIDAMSFGSRLRAYKGEPAGFHYKIERQMFSKTKDQIDAWKRSEAKWRKDLEATIADGEYGMNTKSCRFCDFKPICAAGWTWPLDKDLILCRYQTRSTSEPKKEEVNAIGD